jgi:CHAD domain-containing protein
MAYRLSIADDVPASVRATAREQLERAAERLEEPGPDPIDAIHDARKSLKRTRSLLRLARPALGRKAYVAENDELREIGLALSGTRDADVLVETVQLLAKRFVGQLPMADFDALRDALEREAQSSRDAGAAADREALPQRLRAASARVEQWPLEGADWDAPLEGAARGYARGRSAFDSAREEPTTERLHEWRKRAKDLWYHERLLQEAWPAVLDAHGEEAHVLSELLGDDHDLAVLRGRLEQGIELPAGPAVDLDTLQRLIDERRGELQEQAERLGRRLYAEKPKAFTRRLGRYLRAAVRERRAGEVA